jgi:hypothetical protein
MGSLFNVYSDRAPTTALSGRSLSPTSIRQNVCRQRTQRRSLLRASDMTGFMVVDGAAQHGLSINGTLLILILFTYFFPAYVFYNLILPRIFPAACS